MSNLTVSAKLRRVDPDHILNLFEGIDENQRDCLVLFTNSTPTTTDLSRLKSSKSIEVKLRERTDGLYALTFSLTESGMKDLFSSFVKDLVKSSSQISSEKLGLSYISRRYYAWKNMFNGTEKQKLSFPEIKGLLGELLFMKFFMFAEYGFERAIKSWIGPDGADQDYRIDDTWYEIKTTTSGNTIVKISSLEQLDSCGIGYLCIIKLDKTSISDESSISLNSAVEDLRKTLTIYGCEDILDEKLIQSGYYFMEEYDKICFSYKGMMRFKVDDKFPVLRRRDITHKDIINVEYLIETSNLEKVEGTVF